MIKNLVGQTFDYLTVIKENGRTKSREVIWQCKCQCGNIVNKSAGYLRRNTFHSCGCMRGIHNNMAKNLTGQQFGQLIVLNRNTTYSKDNNLKSKGYWDCKCICGKIITVQTHNLTSGNTKSCGCSYKGNIKDLTGQRFGNLIVLALDKESMLQRPENYTGAIWICKCDCGNIISVKSQNLITESTISCGCIKNKSSGENKIYQLLKENNIDFLFDSTYFKDLILPSNTIGRYDFILFDKNKVPYRLIEYDGEFHYEEGGTNLKRTLTLKQRKEYDEIKNQYARKNNLPLVRIPYWEKKNITFDMLMSDKYLIA